MSHWQEDDPDEWPLDTNLDEMDGIIYPATDGNDDDVSSCSSLSDSDSDSSQSRRPSRKASPNTIVPLSRPPTVARPGDWTAPESWSVADPVGEAEWSSGDTHAPAAAPSESKMPVAAPSKMQIRIYRADNTYNVVSISVNVTVAALTPKLDMKMRPGEEREKHQLYIKERGRERMLSQSERPADIVRRRLAQAGYDESDGPDLRSRGAGLSFLLKFVYKSLFLGPAEKELKLVNFKYIDLTGRSLCTIPVVLHQHADSIVSLRLSRNPLIEIPLDFIQSCTILLDLRLSNMALKKVPRSLRHSTTLTRLDLSRNRIFILDETLSDIPGLTALYAQNNRLEKLPGSFTHLRHLNILDISNNRFRTFPAIVSELMNLRQLDISFNSISELPGEIGRMKNLERLLIASNQVSRLPDEFSGLGRLHELDCRRNQISDLTIACMLPEIVTLSADHNSQHNLPLSLGPCVTTLDVSHNEIAQLSLARGPIERSPVALTSLDISNAKLSVLDDYTLSQLTSLRQLRLDNNSFRSIPDSLGDLKCLETLSCADNSLGELPQSIGKLQKLKTLDVHNNRLTELSVSLWNCGSLSRLNVTSNSLVRWHEPPAYIPENDSKSFSDNRPPTLATVSSLSSSDIPPLARSLELLYLGKNSFTDDILHLLMSLKELRVLNLSFNDIRDMPSDFFRHLTELEEVYLSGNGLISFPSEDLPKLMRLSTLFLNGNRLQTLPHELGKVESLTVLDAGSNRLNYNINNWEFDWNWNFNKNLQYLNLSGNKRLQIKSDVSALGHHGQSVPTVSRESLAGFSQLTRLRVLGLMDVTIATTGTDILNENNDRRVRRSSSLVNGMPYGIADTLGKNQHLNMFDLVHEFRRPKKDTVFAMFGRAQPPKRLPPATTSNRHAKYLQENFVRIFTSQLNSLDPKRSEGVPDALRRSFLKLNHDLHDMLFNELFSAKPINPDFATVRSGASGIVVYMSDKKMYVANVGNVLAVISRGGGAHPVSTKHESYGRAETARIRAAEGWVSPPGLVNDEVDVSRSFGFYHLVPVINARPDIVIYDLTELDEFVIIANRGLWDYVSYQSAVDIARHTEPMLAAQKLRDIAISCGTEASIMIMVIVVADLFKDVSGPGDKRKKLGSQMAKETQHRPPQIPPIAKKELPRDERPVGVAPGPPSRPHYSRRDLPAPPMLHQSDSDSGSGAATVMQSLLAGIKRQLHRKPSQQQVDFNNFQVKYKQTPTELSTKRSEALRSKNDVNSSIVDLLDDQQEINSINPIDALLHGQQRRIALLEQATSPANLRDVLQSCEQLICASLLAILDSRESKDAVLLLEGDRVQSFLDAVQDVIDSGSLSISHTAQARRLVVRLSAASDGLPSSLFITGVTDSDDQPTFRGGFGDVYRASYGGKRVALKRIRMFQVNSVSESKRIRLQFCREALVWQRLRHEYVLPLIGIDRESFPLSFCMVSPWMKHGTVLQYLNHHGRVDVDRLLLQVAEGLGYLHSMNIVHGDLRGMNILVSDNLNACLADFGLTSVIAAPTNDTSSSNHGGSTRWMAPELLQPSEFGCVRFLRTPASDVYAFACVCLELHTGRPPFSDVKIDPPVIFKVIAGERPERPETSMSHDLWALVTAAWAQRFSDRPDIETIIGRLRTNAVEPCITHSLHPARRQRRPRPPKQAEQSG
ncbi:hypothetical protein DFH07DRAFT_44310 [Mycena maculata]|uniref:Non-specific serine/threonine protein kinase n=1 Tax=Mycena maculata TaxID=230809 RepID=A0AAD7N2Y7_9AGAR|nr:hypothetical protein DFH07DRAFT_44310 [Mycena maculata]